MYKNGLKRADTKTFTVCLNLCMNTIFVSECLSFCLISQRSILDHVCILKCTDQYFYGQNAILMTDIKFILYWLI